MPNKNLHLRKIFRKSQGEQKFGFGVLKTNLNRRVFKRFLDIPKSRIFQKIFEIPKRGFPKDS